MDTAFSLRRLCMAAMLIAIGIIIPMFSPLRIVLEPASFTLASHVVIFVAIFISPGVAAAVATGTAVGFFLGGFPLAIVLRAATHLVFALIGAFYLQKNQTILQAPVKMRAFSFLIGIIHGVCEVVAVSMLYFYGQMTSAYYQAGYLRSVMLLVGLGTVIHSMVDFEIAYIVVNALKRQKSFATLFL